MMRPRHSSGTPITPRSVARDSAGHVTAGHVVIAGEPHRSPARDHRAGHALGEREDPARLAGDADVGFFAVGAGGLVDAADRACVAAEQFGAAPQDSLEQRAQRELAGQVLGHGDQPGRARRRTVVRGHRSSEYRLAAGRTRADPVFTLDARDLLQKSRI